MPHLFAVQLLIMLQKTTFQNKCVKTPKLLLDERHI